LKRVHLFEVTVSHREWHPCRLSGQQQAWRSAKRWPQAVSDAGSSHIGADLNHSTPILTVPPKACGTGRFLLATYLHEPRPLFLPTFVSRPGATLF
jgi:hypothetical protein